MSASARRRTTRNGECTCAPHLTTVFCWGALRRAGTYGFLLIAPSLGQVRRGPWRAAEKGRATTVGSVGVAGLEPATSCSQSMRANQAALHPVRRTPRMASPERVCDHCSGHCTLVPRRLHESRGNSGSPVPCGRSSMVEPQPSKLVVRVRFSSPAPFGRGVQPLPFCCPHNTYGRTRPRFLVMSLTLMRISFGAQDPPRRNTHHERVR